MDERERESGSAGWLGRAQHGAGGHVPPAIKNTERRGACALRVLAPSPCTTGEKERGVASACSDGRDVLMICMGRAPDQEEKGGGGATEGRGATEGAGREQDKEDAKAQERQGGRRAHHKKTGRGAPRGCCNACCGAPPARGGGEKERREERMRRERRGEGCMYGPALFFCCRRPAAGAATRQGGLLGLLAAAGREAGRVGANRTRQQENAEDRGRGVEGRIQNVFNERHQRGEKWLACRAAWQARWRLGRRETEGTRWGENGGEEGRESRAGYGAAALLPFT